MTTPVKVGKSKDLYFLTQARENATRAAMNAEGALRELRHMREQMGRPDYSRISIDLADLVTYLSNSRKALDEMALIRAQAKQEEATESTELTQRIAHLEAQISQLTQRMERIAQ
jgi:uncharacterized protein YceH (UPF0502 family)